MRILALLASIASLVMACSEDVFTDSSKPMEIVPAISPDPVVRLSEALPEFRSDVPEMEQPHILDVGLCSSSGTHCLLSEAVEKCELLGSAEIIFITSAEHGYLSLVDRERRFGLELSRKSGSLGGGGQFASDDGRLLAKMRVRHSELSRGRAIGPGLVGELTVELDGGKVPYLYPEPREVIEGPYDCWQEQKQTR